MSTEQITRLVGRLELTEGRQWHRQRSRRGFYCLLLGSSFHGDQRPGKQRGAHLPQLSVLALLRRPRTVLFAPGETADLCRAANVNLTAALLRGSLATEVPYGRREPSPSARHRRTIGSTLSHPPFDLGGPLDLVGDKESNDRSYCHWRLPGYIVQERTPRRCLGAFSPAALCRAPACYYGAMGATALVLPSLMLCRDLIPTSALRRWRDRSQ
jgi:hypothetical protein